jgi:hypothetical protein
MNLDSKKPNLFIIGAAKAGTTSLYELLDQHPQIYFPFSKEPAYFIEDDNYNRGDHWYLKTYFQKAKSQQIRAEATSRYLYYSEKVAPRIFRFANLEQPKFIVIFRDPAKLVYSFYWNSVREGHEPLQFTEALDAEPERMRKLEVVQAKKGQILFAYSKIGLYAQQISNFLDIFPKENFLFLLTEDLMDFSSLVSTLQKFLCLQDGADYFKPRTSNTSAMPKNRKLHQWLRGPSLIKDFIKPLMPYSLRYKLKNYSIERNLEKFNPPMMDIEIENSLRSHYSEETKRLQVLIQRDLTKWLPE